MRGGNLRGRGLVDAERCRPFQLPAKREEVRRGRPLQRLAGASASVCPTPRADAALLSPHDRPPRLPPRRRRLRAARRAAPRARLAVDPWRRRALLAPPPVRLQPRLRGLRTLYVCASREGLAARPPVRPTRGGGARRPPAPPPRAAAAEHEALRGSPSVQPHGEALRELLLALHLGEMEMHTLIIDDLHELLPLAAPGGGAGGGAPRRAEPGAAEPEQPGAASDAGGVHRRARRPRRRLPERGARKRRRRRSRCSSAPPCSAPLPMCQPLAARPARRRRRPAARRRPLTGAHATDPWPAGADGAPPAAHYSLADRRLREVAPPALAAWG